MNRDLEQPRRKESIEYGVIRGLLFWATTWWMGRKLQRARLEVDRAIHALQAKGITGPNKEDLVDRLGALASEVERVSKLSAAQPSLTDARLAMARVVGDAIAEAAEAQAAATGDQEIIALATQYRRASEKADRLVEDLTRRV